METTSILFQKEQETLSESFTKEEEEDDNESSFININYLNSIDNETKGSNTDFDEEELLENDQEEDEEKEENKEEDEQEEGEEEEETSIEDLIHQEYENRNHLKDKIKEWGLKNKMILSFDSSERLNLKDDSRVSKFICQKKKLENCPFYLEFKMEAGEKYKLISYWNVHNHSLNKYDYASSFTPEIIEMIKELKCLSKNVPDLTDTINKKFNKNFSSRAIYYQLSKIKDEENGPMTEDAQNLLNLIEENIKKEGGFLKADINYERILQSFCFMTPRMKKNLNKFNDVIVIDTTHKSNRFNLALLDVIVINNLGKSVTCYFGLLQNQKYETFLWALNGLKEQLFSDPKIIFSDEDEALTKGFFIILSMS